MGTSSTDQKREGGERREAVGESVQLSYLCVSDTVSLLLSRLDHTELTSRASHMQKHRAWLGDTQSARVQSWGSASRGLGKLGGKVTSLCTAPSYLRFLGWKAT